MDDILDFDQQIADEFTTTAPPIAFRFHGEIFKAHGDGPGLIILDFVRASINNNGLAATDAMLSFLEACMPSDEFTRFRAICNDPEIVTPIDHLGLVVKGLIAKYNETPTVPSSSSSDGPSSTDDGSKDGSSDAASESAT